MSEIKLSDLDAAYADASDAAHHFAVETQFLLGRIELMAKEKNIEDFLLPFPITFSGGDYHDEYVRVRFDEDGAVFVDSGGNDTPAGDLPASVVFAFCEQLVNNFSRFNNEQRS